MPKTELLKDAYQIIGGIPERNIDLLSIVTAGEFNGPNPTCNTIACAAGFLGMHQEFQKLGLTTEIVEGVGYLRYWGKTTSEYKEPLTDIFGITVRDATNLFGSRGVSDYDADIADCSDKERFLARVRMFLEDQQKIV